MPPGDSRWAFGTGFEDPLAGVDTSVPPDVDRDDLAVYCLMLGDDALVMSHRLQQWCTNAPELEDEMAIANVGLDLLGQARLLLTRAGKASGSGRERGRVRTTTRSSAPSPSSATCGWSSSSGDFADLIAQLLVFASWRLALLQRLAASRDPVLAAIAAKAVKEVTYHRDYAARVGRPPR